MRRIRKKRAALICSLPLLGALAISLTAAPNPAGKSAPSPPGDPTAAEVAGTSVSLAWTPAAGASEGTQYLIYEYVTAVGMADSAPYTVDGLRPGTKYVFAIKARDAAGNLSGSSKSVTVVTNGTPSPPGPPPTKKVVAYYASWRAYSAYTPDNLDGSKLTAVNYAFADIGKNLQLIVSDPAVDYGNFAALVQLKRTYPHLVTLISVGGWDGSARFSEVARTEALRAAFAESCLQYILTYGFDGVDIDWEYPVVGGKAGNGKRPQDRENFTLLLAAIRARMGEQSAKDGRRYYLTIAGASTPSYVGKYTEMELLAQYVDWINVMTYDMHGGWDKVTDFGAALHNNADPTGQDKLSAADSVRYYLEAGVPPDKLVLGVPFYAQIYTGVKNENDGLYQPFKACGTVSSLYAAILARHVQGYNRYWHGQSMAPWLFNGSTFISYDDPQSLGLKAGFVKERGLGGVMIWEISLDPNQLLLDALLQGMQ